MKALIVAALVAALPAIAHAQQNCAPRDAIAESLTGKYGESLQSAGVGGNGSLVEMWANTATGTWTITVTAPGGPTCMVAAGEQFEAENPAEPAAMGIKA
jgi:hypothetical protein